VIKGILLIGPFESSLKMLAGNMFNTDDMFLKDVICVKEA